MSQIKPTAAELEILGLLWSHGEMSVRDVHDKLSQNRDVFYTTTLKTMQVMLSKGLLGRDTSNRAHIYHAEVAQDEIERNTLTSIKKTLFSDSTAKLVISALGHGTPSANELKEIRDMIDQLENDSEHE